MGLREVSRDTRRENTLGLGDHIWKQSRLVRGERGRVGEEGKRGEKCEVASVSEESLDITITSAETDSRVQGHSEAVDEEAEARDVEEQRTATSDGRGEPGVDQSTGFEQSEGDVAVESSDGATIHSTDTGRAAVDTGSGVSEGIGCGSSENSTVQTVGGKYPIWKRFIRS